MRDGSLNLYKSSLSCLKRELDSPYFIFASWFRLSKDRDPLRCAWSSWKEIYLLRNNFKITGKIRTRNVFNCLLTFLKIF